MNSIILNKPEQTKDFNKKCLLEREPTVIAITQEDVNKICGIKYIKDMYVYNY